MKKYRPWQLGNRCRLCKKIFIASRVCPKCGDFATPKDEIAVRYTWNENWWTAIITLGSYLGVAKTLEERSQGK